MSLKLIVGLFALGCLTLALTVTLVAHFSPDPDEHAGFQALLLARCTLDQDVTRHALEARFAFSASYDALAKDDADYARIREQLTGNLPRFLSAEERSSLLEDLRRYDGVADDRARLLEHFKSENALLRNSIRYFPKATSLALQRANDAEVRATIEELRSLTLSLALHDDVRVEVQQQSVLTRLSGLGRERLSQDERKPVESLLAHARAIAMRKTNTDQLLGKLLQLPFEGARSGLKAHYQAAYARAERQRRFFEHGVSALALVLLALVARAGLQLRRAAQGLSKANERLEQAVAKRTTELEAEMKRRSRVEIELRQAQKLEAVGQLASGIAHEINTPIQYVGDSLYFLREASADLLRLVLSYGKLADELRVQGDTRPSLIAAQELAREIDVVMLQAEMPEALERTADGAKQVASIVKAMKTFAHTSVEKAPLDLNGAIENTLIVSRNEYKYVAELETSFAQLPDVTCNAGGVRQVLLNLIVNAAHAVADTGADSEHRGRIRISTTAHEDHVTVTVADSGTGIPEALRERIFDPFFTTKEPGRGSGQGLAICQSIVTQHGGKLWFESELGRGTSFFFELPLKPSERHEPDAASRAA